MLVAWIGLSAWLLGWALTSGAWVIAGHGVSFATWTVLFFVVFSLRGQATAAVNMQRALAEDATGNAAAYLQILGGRSTSDDREVLAGAGVSQLAQSIVCSALLPLFWGLVLGAGGALAALCVQHISGQITDDQHEDSFWQPVARIGVWITTVPCWLALFFIQATLPFAGGQRGAAMTGFLNVYKANPLDRVTIAVAYGLGLGPSAGGHEDGDPVGVADLHRATILLWISTGLAAVTIALLGSLLYRFIL